MQSQQTHGVAKFRSVSCLRKRPAYCVDRHSHAELVIQVHTALRDQEALEGAKLAADAKPSRPRAADERPQFATAFF